MKYKKIVLVSVVSLSLMCAQNIFAAAQLSVPNNPPLQPIPAGAAPNVSNNINSENSHINQNLESQIPVVENPGQNSTGSSNNNQTNPQPNPIAGAPIVGEVPTTSTTFYWFLLFVGITGLVALGLWAYFRFWRKR